MDWKTYYSEHTMTAAEAVSKIKSGDRVAVGHACSEPTHLIEAMVANAKAYRNVEITHMVAMGKAEYCNPETPRISSTMPFSWAPAPVRLWPRSAPISLPASSMKCPACSKIPT